MTSDSGTATPSRRRQPKGDKRDRTKAKLVQATIELIREKGFEHTTLAEVAERAGMTTGAIYWNFKNRDDLFMAVAEVKGGPIVADIRPGMSAEEVMRAMADAVIAAIPQRRDAMLGTLAFHTHTLKHEELRSRVLADTAEAYRKAAAATLALAPEDQLPMSVDNLVRVMHALTDGLLLRRILTPELIPDEVFHEAFALFARVRPN